MSNSTPNPGAHVQECRIRAKLTQTQVAVALGVTEQAVSAWERDLVPIPKNRIVALWRLIKIDRSELLNRMAARYRAELADCVREGMKA